MASVEKSSQQVVLPGQLDLLQHEQLFDIVQTPSGAVGSLHVVDWDLLLKIGKYLLELSSEITSRPVSDFRLLEVLEPVGNRSRAGVALCISDDNVLSDELSDRRAAAANLFILLVAGRADVNEGVLTLDQSLDKQVVDISHEYAEAFLRAHGGDPIAKPLLAFISGKASPTSLRKCFAPKPFVDTPLQQVQLIVFFEGADRQDRDCRILKKGDKGKGFNVKISVERDLEAIHARLFNNRPYAIVLQEVKDASGKIDWIILNVGEAADANDHMELEPPSPTIRSKGHLGKNAKNLDGNTPSAPS